MNHRRFRAAVPAFFLAVFLCAVSAAAETIRIANPYVGVDFDTVSGRYMVRTAAGDPALPSDDNQAITGDFLNSSVVVKLDNQYYRFGDTSGQMIKSFARGDTALFVWSLKGMEISQEIRLTNSPFSTVPSFVKIRYWLKNTDKTYHYAGLRVLLDTMLGQNDDGMIMDPASGIVGREKEYSFDSVPDYWTAWDSLSSPTARCLMSFVGNNVVKPDYLTFASRKRLTETKWDFTADPNRDFRSYAMEPPDTCVSMKWESIPFKPGYENGVSFYYGAAKAAANDKMPPLDLLGLAPSETGDPGFWVQAEALNSDPSKSIKNLKLKLELPAGLILAQGSPEQTFPEVKPGEKRVVFWYVTVKEKGNYPIKVTGIGTTSAPLVNQVTLQVNCR